MKDFARNVMIFLTAHGIQIYYVMIVAVVCILVFSAVRAHKTRGSFSYMKAEKPVSSKEYFHAAFSANEYVDDEDYINYRDQFNAVEADEDALTRWEYLAEVYAPKLIKGCIISLILMVLVASPYLVIKFFA